MITPADRSPLIRLASSLPTGSDERRTILATLRKIAAVADDTVARADLVSGAMSGNKTQDRGPVLKAMQSGIEGFLREYNAFARDLFDKHEVKTLKDLREVEDLEEEDEKSLKSYDKRFKGYGAIAPKLVDLLGQIGESSDYAYDVLSNRVDHKMREAVMAGAAKGIHGMVETLDSGRRQVTDIGRGGISTPGSHGVDAEDLAQVMLGGGLFMPGMIFDMRASGEEEVAPGVKVRGMFKERKKPWSPAGSSIYTIAGAARGHYVKPGKNYARTVAMNAAVDWKRSVHVELEYILKPAEEHESADTSAINMGGKVSLESLLGAEIIDGVPMSRQLILAKYYLKKIRQAMKRVLDAGNQRAIWEAVAEMITSGENPWKGAGRGGEFAIAYDKVIPFLEKTREGKAILAENGVEPGSITKNNIQRDWGRVRQKMQKALAQLSDDDLLTAIHLSVDAGGLVDDVPEFIRKIKEDKDLYKTYISDMRKTASERSATMKTITASERSAMIRLAATLPVGSPERRAILAGCEKLPNKAMQENCEKKKEEAAKKEAGCENLPNEKMQQMCEDKKKEGEKKEAGEVPDALKEHQFTSEDNPNPKGNDKDGDGKTNEPSPVKSKKAEHHEESKEKYPWPECIKDQEKEYGSKEIAEKVCGKIKAESQGRSASPKSALIRLAASMPKGSEERKTLIRMAAGA